MVSNLYLQKAKRRPKTWKECVLEKNATYLTKLESLFLFKLRLALENQFIVVANKFCGVFEVTSRSGTQTEARLKLQTKAGWPSGLKRCLQVAVSSDTWVRIPLLSLFSFIIEKFSTRRGRQSKDASTNFHLQKSSSNHTEQLIRCCFRNWRSARQYKQENSKEGSVHSLVTDQDS